MTSKTDAELPDVHATTMTSEGAAASEAELELLPVDAKLYAAGGEVARGGMGRIVLARDRRLGRDVALKQLLGRDVSLRVRFEREALITARLQHPAIIPVYEAGVLSTGEPFYAMKMVAGRPLDKVFADTGTLVARLALVPNVLAVAEALAYAHEHHVIHRDLKPANVLVGDFGETVVIDWGLAKDLRGGAAGEPAAPYRGDADAHVTLAGAVMGTPSYMPPEQALGEMVDERADVYALGAILYHLLAGRPPYTGRSADEVLARVLAAPPAPLVEVEPDAPADLRTIVDKAMARATGDRYATAKELAADLRRFQTGQLVGSHRYSLRELVFRWIRRHRAVVSLSLAFVVVLIVVGVLAVRGILAEKRTAERQKAAAESAQKQATEYANDVTVQQARTVLATDPTAAMAWLKNLRPDGGGWGAASVLALEARARGVAARVFTHRSIVFAPMASDDASVLVTLTGDAVHAWDLRRGTRIATRGVRVADAALSPDGAIVAIVQEPAAESGEGPRKLVAWKPRGDEITDLAPDAGQVLFAPGTSQIYFTTGSELESWSPSTHAIETVASDVAPRSPVAVSFDGARVAYTRADHAIVVVERSRASSPRTLSGHTDDVEKLGFLADGRLMSASSRDRTLRVWSEAGVATILDDALRSFGAPSREVAWSRDGQVLAFIGEGGAVVVKRLGRDREFTRIDLRGQVSEIVLSPDGETLATVGDELTLIDVAEHEVRALGSGTERVTGATFAGDHWLVSTSNEGIARVWSLENGVRIGRAGAAPRARFSHDGRFVAVQDDEAQLVLADLRAGTSRPLPASRNGFGFFQFSPDGATLAWLNERGLELYPVAGGEPRRVAAPEGPFAFAPDGKTIVLTGESALVFVDVARGAVTRTAALQDSGPSNVLWSPDGRHLLLDAGSRARVVPSPSSSGEPIALGEELVNDARWLDDGRVVTVTIAAAAPAVRVWQLSDGKYHDLPGLDHIPYTLAVSSDGASIAVTTNDKAVFVWDVRTFEHRALRGANDVLARVEFAGPERLIGAGNRDLRVWDVQSGVSGDLHAQWTNPLAVAPDGSAVVAVVHGWYQVIPLDVPPTAALAGWLTEQTCATLRDGALVCDQSSSQ